MRSRLRLLVSAPEPSGDAAAAAVLEAFAAAGAELEAFGIGGPACRAQGLELLPGEHEEGDGEAVAVVGIAEAVRGIPRAFQIRRRLADAAVRRRADVALLVDLPETHVRVAEALTCPTLLYGAPQVWAWRPGRAGRFVRAFDQLAVLLPFEAPWWRRAGATRVEFVGHPAVARAALASTAAAGAGLEPALRPGPVVALLPGSRTAERARLTPLFAATAQRLRRRMPGVRFVTTGSDLLGPDTQRAGSGVEALARADVGVCASGSVTLEAAALGVPVVVCYRTNPVTWWLGRALVSVRHVALPNLLSGHALLPELLQERCTPEALAAAVEQIRQDRARLCSALQAVAQRCAGPGPSPAARVASLIGQLKRATRITTSGLRPTPSSAPGGQSRERFLPGG